MLKRLTSKLLHLSMTWKSVLLLALVTGAVTGLLAQADFLSRTSFADITVSHEWWVFFALLILVNQTRWWEAGLKTLVFFLVSQTVVFLVEWPLAGGVLFCLLVPLDGDRSADASRRRPGLVFPKRKRTGRPDPGRASGAAGLSGRHLYPGNAPGSPLPSAYGALLFSPGRVLAVRPENKTPGSVDHSDLYGNSGGRRLYSDFIIRRKFP